MNPRRLSRFAAIGTFLAIACGSSSHAASVPEETTAGATAITDVFVGGEDFHTFRIPALLATKSGALLAFCEGRESRSDQAGNDLVLKRSSDGGQTWSALQIIAEDGDNSLNNPTVVQVAETGRVLLMYQRYALGFDERRAEPGLDGPHICRTFLRQSDDDGATWSAPRDITASVKRSTATSTATGPGNGIQLTVGAHAGRVLMPFNQGPAGHWTVYAAISDDRGESWRFGEVAADTTGGHANEVQFAELADGTVLLNARNEGGARVRKIAQSHDGGETWSPLADEPALPEPQCQASLLSIAAGDGRLLIFSNPASQKSRRNGTVRLSSDDGKSWSAGRVICPGSFAYCSLAALPEQQIACLFEREDYRKISFCHFPLKSLQESAPQK